MTVPTNTRIRQRIVGRYTEWIKRFDVDDYVDNAPLIEKLYEEKQLAMTQALEMEKQLEHCQESKQQLELLNRDLRHELSNASHHALVVIIISFLIVVAVGFAINILSSNSGATGGWVLLALALIMQLVVFFIKPREKRASQND